MLRIDFISDINCPWCALALANLDAALHQLDGAIPLSLHFQPFELNPQLGADGVKLVEYLQQKYAMSQAQIDEVHNTLRARGAEVGFNFGKREYIWNSFNAHRLIYWAGQELSLASQGLLKRALMQAYQGQGRNISDTQVLADLVASIGLDKTRASALLASDEFSREVRALEAQWQGLGIQAVPGLVFDNKHLLQGAQPVELMVKTIRDLAQTI